MGESASDTKNGNWKSCRIIGQVIFAVLMMCLGQARTYASPLLFTENFNSITNETFNGTQYQSGWPVAYGGDLAGWSKSGGNAVHVVEPTGTSSDFAVMIWQDNVITLNSAITGSNTTGQRYTVYFRASPAVYQASNQATQAGDALMIEVLRADNSVLASYSYQPGAWAGNLSFKLAGFSYVGDGSGDVTLRIRSANQSSGTFAGAIDDLNINADTASNLEAEYNCQGNLLDSSGHSRNLSLVAGTVGYSVGAVGSACHFDGYTGVRTTYGVLPTSASATYAFWLKAAPAPNQNVIMQTVPGNSSYNTWNGIDVGYEPGAGTADFKVWGNNSFQPYSIAHTPQSAMFDNTWHHVVVTTLGLSSTVVIYVDGVQAPTTFGAGSPATMDLESTFYLGMRSDFLPNGTLNFIGDMQDIRLYSRALSASDVAALYVAGPSGAPPVLSSPAESPATGNPGTSVTYKVVYTDAANTAPSAIEVCIDANPCQAMSLDTGAAAALQDGVYTNGEQYAYSTTLAVGNHTYYFTASDGVNVVDLPASGTSSGPSISMVDQTISFNSWPGSLTVGGSGSVTASGGASGNAVTFSSTTTGVCTSSGTNGSTVTGVTAGTCIIAADQAGNGNYNAATQVTQSFSVGMADQTISFGSAPTFVGSSGSVSATGGASGNPVIFSSTTTAVCTVSGSTVTAVAGGTCVIAANQAGNANYNAAAQATQSFAVGADLTVSALSSSIAGSVLAGSTVTISDTLTNQGSTRTAASSVSERFYLSTDPVITTADLMIGSRSLTSLAAGASSSGSTTATIPANLAPGTYYIGAIVDFTNVEPETNEGNNTRATAAFTVTAGSVDLVVSALSSAVEGGSVNAGGTVTIHDTMTNQGSMKTTASSVAERFYLSTDPVVTTADLMIGSRSVTSLAAGASSSGTTTATIPANLAPGTYYIGAIIDFTNMQPESNEGNNTAVTASFTVVRDVDLVVSALSSTVDGGSVSAGSSFTIYDTMANLGSTKTTASSVAERFYLSTNASITTADTMIGSRSVSSLAGGASSSGATSVRIPSNLAPGTYYIGAYVDFVNMQPETNESNNTRLSLGTVTVN
jgi:hypothetical protein